MGIFLVKLGNQTFYHNLVVLNPIRPDPKHNFKTLIWINKIATLHPNLAISVKLGKHT